MGARNVVLAFTKWADRVPPTSFMLLAYMAVVARDDDDEPWYSEGHEALAEKALGRHHPNASDIRAVTRAITPLLHAGAIVSDRKAAPRREGGRTVRYRLNLALNLEVRTTENVVRLPVDKRPTEPVDSGQRTTETVPRTYDEIR